MAQISARTAAWAKWAVVPVALLVGGVAVSQASYSAFSATSDNSANNWTAGTVKLDNNASTATFAASTLKPGASETKCITVSSSGSMASAVKLYAKDYNTKPAVTNDLSPYIDLVITQGTVTGTGCAGFTALVGASVYSNTLKVLGGMTTFQQGFGDWAPKGTTATGGTAETRTFQITYTLDANTPNTAQGGTASVGFTWEAQNS